jgi:hypothetical protein
MPSPSKLQSDRARANGAKSRGPVTEEGRRKSSMNAIKHGLTAQTLVLPNEDPEEYQQMLDSYLDHFHPAGQIELDLVHEMAAAKWRQGRLWAVETELLTQQMQEQAERLKDDYPDREISRLTLAFRALEVLECLPSVNRIEARLERAYSRALRNLLQLQAYRRSTAPAATAPPPSKQISKNEPTPPRERPSVSTAIAAAPAVQLSATGQETDSVLHFDANHSKHPDP